MVKKAFWEDPYLMHLETYLTNVDGNNITVAQTIFYAFSGGQESDSGSIGGYPVLNAQKDGKEIIYTLADGHNLENGDEVTIMIDWERRYRLMRLHFAAEIVLELVYQNTESIKKIGAHISEDKSRIDFLWDQNISTLFPLICDYAERLIQANQTIVSAYSDEVSEKRYWEIDGFARVPCGGTHLKQTGEVGNIRLKRKNVGKSKERIEISLA